MIRKLILERFGKFTGAAFDFGPVTLFMGENESGKTTVFDALLSVITSLGERSALGKSISRRYGPPRERSCSIEWSGSPLSIREDEFINLYAIRSGEPVVELASGKTWLDRVKSSIFTGGIDPAKIRDDLARAAAEKGNYAHVREMKDTRLLLDRKRKDHDDLLSKRELLLNRRGELQGLDREIGKLRGLEKKLGASIAEIEGSLSQQSMIDERKRRRDILAHLVKGEKLSERARSLSRFRVDRSAEIEGLKNDTASAEKALAAAEARVDESLRALRERQKNLESARSGQSEGRFRREVAAELLASILSAASVSVPRRVNLLGIVAAAAMVAAGVAGFVFLGSSGIRLHEFIGPFELALGALGTGIAAAFTLIILSFRHPGAGAGGGSAALAVRVRDEWRARTGGGLSSEGIDGIRMEFLSLKSEGDALARNIAIMEKEIGDMVRDLEKAREGVATLRKDLDGAQGAYARLIAALRVSDPGEYAVGLAEYRKAEEALDAWRGETEALLRSHSTEDEAALEAECRARIAALEKEITEGEKTPAERNGMDARLRKERKEREALRERIGGLEKEIHTGRGEVQGSLGDIPDQIVASEAAMAALARDLARLDLDRRASALGQEIFAAMAERSDIQLQGLADEIALHFSGILPGSRGIAIGALDSEGIAVEDAGGAMRPMGHLSRGTLDSFYLAARLAMALRSREEPGVLLLDEPFHALDDGREEKALELLRRVSETHGWQIVIFSKDDDMERRGLAVFGERIMVHRLGAVR